MTSAVIFGFYSKSKNKQVELYQSKKRLYSNEKDQLNERTMYWKGENTYKPHIQ